VFPVKHELNLYIGVPVFRPEHQMDFTLNVIRKTSTRYNIQIDLLDKIRYILCIFLII
jgi:hypothetical protein